ncbi:AroM family protein [Streptomyces lonarensis]|uniref:AroM family protein n=1 Tax=Streptomyces lonarensis TaxID=700599 RepID=A0A7X6HZY4_9ACTN|nr:AroM family protein [Streptomyces lonarensis]NJQ07126.1 AroM family protein [Streptomyces lonarensis]
MTPTPPAPAGPDPAAPALGLVTIGQAPRSDLHRDAAPLLAGTAVTEHGALDEDRFDPAHEAATRAELAPGPNEAPLVSRLRDGRSVELGHHALLPRMARAVARAEADGALATLVLCTGSFPELPAERPLLFAEPLVQRAVAAVAEADPVGVCCPHADQAEDVGTRWRQVLAGPVTVTGADPYAPGAAPLDQVARAATELAEQGSRWIVLDCIGYTEEMRRAAAEASGLPVLLARSLAVRLAAEVVAAHP